MGAVVVGVIAIGLTFPSFSSSKTQAYAADFNSQTLGILDSSTAPSLAVGGADIILADDMALKSMSGPATELASDDRRSVNPGNVSMYEVREGDTLGGIAEMFGVSVDTITWANNKTTAIKPGDTLVILPVTGVRYTVKSGDTVDSIVEKNNSNLQEVLSLNGLALDGRISPGEVLTIPTDTIPNAVPVQVASKTTAGTSSNASKGYLIRPLKKAFRTQGIHGNNAVDLAAPAGTPVFAAANGTVETSFNDGGWNGGYGNYVVIKHPNGTKTLYAHEGSTIVDVGQKVVQGQVIGYVGSTGKSTGNHVHFEVRGATNPF